MTITTGRFLGFRKNYGHIFPLFPKKKKKKKKTLNNSELEKGKSYGTLEISMLMWTAE